MGTSAVEQPVAPDRPAPLPDRPVPRPERAPALAGVRSLGILGGTFNPPHLGHLALARHALNQLGLQRVLMMPAHIPPHKPTEEDPRPEHRLRMCRLSVRDAAGISVCALEIERGGPSYTVDTLRAIHASHPGAQLTFIVGADTACTLPAWREPAVLLGLADLAVAARDGSGRTGVKDTVAPLLAAGRPQASNPGAALTFLDMPAIEVSSSMARDRVARGEPVEDLLGAAVAGYIAEHGLYRTPTEEGN
jgi:nicotinate-nucleotide adenylyltransferase